MTGAALTAVSIASANDLTFLALQRGRTALPVLQSLIPDLYGPERRLAEVIATSVSRRDIIKSCVVDDLNDLSSILGEEISGMVVTFTNWSDDPSDMSGTTWTEIHWPPRARKFDIALGELIGLRDAIGARPI